MESFTTEEQQVEAIKKFWRDNGTAIIVGAALGLAGLWGYRYYTDTQLAAKESASAAYAVAADKLQGADNNITEAATYVEQHKDSSYASLLALQLAKAAVDAKDLTEARKQLSFVIEQNANEAIVSLARVRLARVQLAEQDFDGALSGLDKVTQEAFSAQVSELKGDLYAQRGELDKARLAYSEALEGNETNMLLKMKLDNLAGSSTDA